MRGTAARNRGKSRSLPWYQPKYTWVSVPSSCGRCGHTPEWGMTGRVPSALRSDLAMARSRMDRLNVGSSIATRKRAPTLASSIGSCGTSVLSMAIGSLWPHQMATDGWWPSRRTAASACRTACLRTLLA
jgi:hypothetical protein